MKIIWEANDIEPGMRVRKPGCNETWMVGYDPKIPTTIGACRKYAVISLLDGMLSRRGLSLDDVADHFNSTEVHPTALVGEVDQ